MSQISGTPSGRFVDALNAAGIKTATARGFWGGIADNGDIVVTSWTDARDARGRYYIWRPATNHGGLKAQWEFGNIRVGTAVRLILLSQRGNLPLGVPGRSVARAELKPAKWRVAELTEGAQWQAVVEQSE